MDKTLLFHNTLDYYINNQYRNYKIMVKMIIDHFESARKGFLDTLDFLNLWDCQYGFVISSLHRRNNPDDAINYLQTLPLTDEQKHVLYGFILLRACGGNPDVLLDKEHRITFKRIREIFLGYPYDTPEKAYCTADNFLKELEMYQNTPPEYFDSIDEIYSWLEKKLEYKFACSSLTIENRFDLWLENNGCYASVNTDEYRQYLTIDNFRKFIKDNPDVIKQPQHKENSVSVTSHPQTNTDKPQKNFADYLIYSDKTVLIEKLKPIFKGSKGKEVAVRLVAMREAGLIAWADGERRELYAAMREKFGEIGTDRGIDKYLCDTSKGIDKTTKIDMITNLLPREEVEPFINQMKVL
jgi:hypothetical protein